MPGPCSGCESPFGPRRCHAFDRTDAFRARVERDRAPGIRACRVRLCCRCDRLARPATNTAISNDRATPMPTILRPMISAALGASRGLAGPLQAVDKVTVGTGGSAGDAPFYIAQDKGYFRNEGLDVNFIILDSGAKVIARSAPASSMSAAARSRSASGTPCCAVSSSGWSPTAATPRRATSTRPYSCART